MIEDITFDLEIDPDDKKYNDEMNLLDRKIAACQRYLMKWYIAEEQCRRGVYRVYY